MLVNGKVIVAHFYASTLPVHEARSIMSSGCPSIWVCISACVRMCIHNASVCVHQRAPADVFSDHLAINFLVCHVILFLITALVTLVNLLYIELSEC